MANTASPPTMMRLRPQRSDAMPSGSWNTACVSPYSPIASPTMAASLPPGYLLASRANTGSTKNSPSMRSAKINAKLPLARNSCEVIVLLAAAWGVAERDSLWAWDTR